MMKFHEKVAGRKTRSKNTWEINEKMIFEKKGLLVKVSEKNKVFLMLLFFTIKIVRFIFLLALIELCLVFIKIFLIKLFGW